MSPQRTDIRLANEAWEAVMTAHARLLEIFAAERVFDEVSMREYDVLYTLSKHSEAMRLSEVQQGVLLSQPALSRLMDRLVARGLVERRIADEDRRAVQLSLTERGRQTQQKVGRLHARSVARELGSTLGSAELAELRRIASKLTTTDQPQQHEEGSR